jgi:hypothetical protein
MSSRKETDGIPEISDISTPPESPKAGLSAAKGGHVQPDECGGKQPLRAYGIIPVGQEPPSQPLSGDQSSGENAGINAGGLVAAVSVRAVLGGRSGNRAKKVRNPEGLKRYKSALDEKQVFVQVTMRDLRRAEIAVWLAIHGCKGRDTARISVARIKEITGIKGQRHVTGAIRSLIQRGLLKVAFRGRFRPNGCVGAGMASVYRIYPSAEPNASVARHEAGEGEANSTVGAPKPR